MTFRTSILLSLALHMALFGTGIAFARLAGDLLQVHHEPILVALIGSEGTSAAGSEEEKARPKTSRSHERKSTAPAEEVVQKRQAPVRHEQQAPVPDVRRETPLPPAAPVPQASMTRQQTGEGTAAGQQGPVPKGGPIGESNGNQPAAAGSRSGTVSSEQWAVIVSSIERAKSYPRLARERGIEGVVRLRFRVKPQGDVERVEIVQSSGSDILDTASVRTLFRAGPLPYVSGWVEVPIAYVLR